MHLLWNVSTESAFLISFGKEFQIRHPEYRIEPLKSSSFGLGGMKQPDADDLRAGRVSFSPLNSKFSLIFKR